MAKRVPFEPLDAAVVVDVFDVVEVVELAVEEVERNLGGQAVLRPTRMLLNVKLLKELASIEQFSSHTPSQNLWSMFPVS